MADSRPTAEFRSALADGPVRGRGAQLNPANRFERHALHILGEHLDEAAAQRGGAYRQVATHVLPDDSRTVVNRVDSPDLGFHWTLNPYRGCEHGCIYCYARPGHEYLSLSSGLDFETKIFAKHDAPHLLRKHLSKPSWRGEPIVMSGVTDCYQPIESRLKITRQCLEVMAEFRQAVSIVTKSRLILRDIDLLSAMAADGRVHVAVSLTSLDNRLASVLEPRAVSPSDRLWTIRRLTSAGVPVHVMVAPIIPVINDRQIPDILRAAADAGATSAAYVLLRLPHQIKELFENWLEEHFPDRRRHVLNLLRQMHEGKLYDARWRHRQRGDGPYARQIEQTFKVFVHRYQLNRPLPPLNTTAFHLPADDAQMTLF